MKFLLLFHSHHVHCLRSFVPKGKCYTIPEKCVKCGQCLVPGCPAMTKNADGTVAIDEDNV